MKEMIMNRVKENLDNQLTQGAINDPGELKIWVQGYLQGCRQTLLDISVVNIRI